MSNTGRPANLPWPVSTGSRRFVVRPTRLSADPYLAWGIAAPNGNSIFLPAARDRVQEILEVHREGKDDCRAALVGDHVEGREIAKRSEEHTSELQSLMRISYAVFCLKKKMKVELHK